LVMMIRAALSRVYNAVLLRLGRRAGMLLRSGAVVHAALGFVGLWLLAVRTMGRLDIDVCDSASLAIARDSLILVRGLGELGDDVPGVEKTGDKAKHAEENVDKGVGAADATLDPDRQRGEENGENTKEDVGGTHCSLGQGGG